MHDTLTKPWAVHAAGTAVADNPTEAAELGAVEVAPVRFAYLRDNGFFKPAPPQPVPKAVPAAFSEAAPDLRAVADVPGLTPEELDAELAKRGL